MTLEQRHRLLHRALDHHGYVCRHGEGRVRFWHCRAKGWTKRSLDRTHRALYGSVSGPAWLIRAFMCIHRYEGAWNAIDPSGTYYGGLQMDLDFQRLYGADFLRLYGTADKWPPSAQLAVALRAYRSGRGFWPWPTAARLCGLL